MYEVIQLALSVCSGPMLSAWQVLTLLMLTAVCVSSDACKLPFSSAENGSNPYLKSHPCSSLQLVLLELNFLPTTGSKLTKQQLILARECH